MANSPNSFAQRLQACIELTHDLDRHEEAHAQFQTLREWVESPEGAPDPGEAAAALELLWQELIRARRSPILWQQSCDLERGLTDRIAESHVQLQQNYMRLIQEQ